MTETTKADSAAVQKINSETTKIVSIVAAAFVVLALLGFVLAYGLLSETTTKGTASESPFVSLLPALGAVIGIIITGFVGSALLSKKNSTALTNKVEEVRSNTNGRLTALTRELAEANKGRRRAELQLQQFMNKSILESIRDFEDTGKPLTFEERQALKDDIYKVNKILRESENDA